MILIIDRARWTSPPIAGKTIWIGNRSNLQIRVRSDLPFWIGTSSASSHNMSQMSECIGKARANPFRVLWWIPHTRISSETRRILRFQKLCGPACEYCELFAESEACRYNTVVPVSKSLILWVELLKIPRATGPYHICEPRNVEWVLRGKTTVHF